MVKHIRYFAHGNGQLAINMRNLDSPIPGYDRTILTWSWCRICQQVSSVILLSPNRSDPVIFQQNSWIIHIFYSHFTLAHQTQVAVRRGTWTLDFNDESLSCCFLHNIELFLQLLLIVYSISLAYMTFEFLVERNSYFKVTPVVPLSFECWSLSFAKYLELRFYASEYTRRASPEPCGHSLHHDHYQYFSFGNMAASFK